MRLLLLLRATVVTAGGQLLVSAGAIAAVAAFLRDALLRRRPRPLTLLGATAALGYQFAAKPWMRSWGATPAETRRALPGDDLVPEPRIQITQAVTIAAPVEQVWPWLAQIGQDRGGFYSYEWLENLAGCEMRNADQIHPEWQQREVGEPVPLHPATPGLPVTIFEPGRVIGLEGWGIFLVEPAGPAMTRLIAHGRIPGGLPFVGYEALLDIPHFVMQRKMLLEIKARAEAGSAPPPAGA
ncbi:MAG TPA: hypothetical protein VIT89_00350 [Solirubrobacterales bacterium]